MIAACPKCAVRYRIDPEWVGAAGRRLRCARCETVFRVSGGDVPAVHPEVSEVTAPVTREAPQQSGREPSAEPAAQILIADSRVEDGKQTAAAVASCGLRRVLVHDGAEAMTAIGRMLPAVAILDVALPKMRGIEICEYVKRVGPASTRIILIGALQHRDRGGHPDAGLFGPDVYLDRSELAEGLIPALRGLGVISESVAAPDARLKGPVVPHADAPSVATVTPEADPARSPRDSAAGEGSPGEAARVSGTVEGGEEFAEAHAYAERFARVIVSDIALYYADRLEAAVRDGKVLEQLDDVLTEGRELFKKRVDARVGGDRDYVGEELLRVARERGAQ